MLWFAHLALNIHIFFGLLSVFLFGPIALLSRKGSRLHIFGGRFFVLSGALLIFFSLITLIDLALKNKMLDFVTFNVYAFAKMHKVDQHYVFFITEYVGFIFVDVALGYLLYSGVMFWVHAKRNGVAYIHDWILAIFMTIFYLLFFSILIPVYLIYHVAILVFILGIAPLVLDALSDMIRFKRKRQNAYSSPMIHMRKMIYAYALVITAFLLRCHVVYLPTLINILPEIIAIIIIAGYYIYYAKRPFVWPEENADQHKIFK